jgi:hypothetical protein
MFAQARQIAHFLCNHPLTRDHRAAAFLRLCRWQIESRLRREVIIPWIGGIQLAAHHTFIVWPTLSFVRSGVSQFIEIG